MKLPSMVLQPNSRAKTIAMRAGLGAALLVSTLGLVLLLVRPQQWSATSSLLIIPKTGQSEVESVPGLYDVLSRGQVPATYAELLRNQSLVTDAVEELELPAEISQEVSLEVLVVPETSVLDLKILAGSADVAEQVAVNALTQSESYLSRLDTPYTVVVIGNGSAQSEGLAPLPLAAVLWVVAAAAGISVQQAVLSLYRAREARSEAEGPEARLLPISSSPELPAPPPPAGSRSARGAAGAASSADGTG